MDIKVGKQAIAEATEKLKNWGRWGKDDQIGTLNHVTPEDIVKAAGLIRTRQGVRARHPARPQRPADRPVRRTLQSDPPDARDRHRRHRRPAGLEQDSLRRRHAQSVRPGRHPLGRARAHLLRGQGLQRLRRQADRLRGAQRARHRAFQEQDGRARRAARHRALPRRGLAQGRRRHLQRRARRVRQGAERRDRPRRLRHRPHRADGALPHGEEMGRLCRRRRAGRQVRELLLVPGQADRRDLHRHLGRRGAAERDHGGEPALALGGDPGHGPVHGRDLLSQGAGRGLRRPTASTSSSSAARR